MLYPLSYGSFCEGKIGQIRRLKLIFHGWRMQAENSTQKTRLQNLVRHKSGRYYARLYLNGKELWKSGSVSVCKKRKDSPLGIQGLNGNAIFKLRHYQ